MDDWDRLQAMYGPLSFGEDPRPKQGVQTKKKKNFWLDQVSTAGGILGGIGGSFIAPVAGTAGGAAAGSALGEALENLISGESVGKNVAKEAALGGVFGAGPIRLAKYGLGAASGLKAGAGVRGVMDAGIENTTRKLIPALRSTVDDAAQAGTRSSKERFAQAQLGDVYGTKPGTKVFGNYLTPQKAGDINKFLTETVQVPKTGNANMALESLSAFKDETGSAIGAIVKANNRNLTKSEALDLTRRIEGKLAGLTGLDYTTNNTANTLLKQIKDINSIEDLHKFRMGVDDLVNYNRNSAAADPAIERIARAVRGEVSDATTNLIPGIKAVQTNYKKATEALDYVAPAAKTPKGINVMNNKIGAGVSQRIKATTGNALTGGVETLGKRKATSGPIGMTGREFTANRVSDSMNPPDLESAMIDAQSEENIMSPTSMTAPNNIQNSIGGLSQDSANSSSPFSLENVETNVEQILAGGGSVKEVNEYLSMVKSINALKPKTGDSKLNSSASGVIADTTTGLKSLDELQQKIAKSNANNPIIGQIRAKNPFDTNAQNLQASIATAKQIVGKALEGGVLRKEDEFKYAKILPTVGDTDAVAQHKIAELINLISSRLNEYQNRIGASSPDSLEDALIQSQGY